MAATQVSLPPELVRKPKFGMASPTTSVDQTCPAGRHRDPLAGRQSSDIWIHLGVIVGIPKKHGTKEFICNWALDM